jgi:hypothetical protein
MMNVLAAAFEWRMIKKYLCPTSTIHEHLSGSDHKLIPVKNEKSVPSHAFAVPYSIAQKT